MKGFRSRCGQTSSWWSLPFPFSPPAVLRGDGHLRGLDGESLSASGPSTSWRKAGWLTLGS